VKLTKHEADLLKQLADELAARAVSFGGDGVE
jgi:hypothetical protein